MGLLYQIKRLVFLPAKALIAGLYLLVLCLPAQAQSFSASVTDTLAKSADMHTGPKPVFAANVMLKDPALQQNLQVKLNDATERQKLMAYLKQLTNHENNLEAKKLYYNLANAFARIKLYPLAMKCFFKSGQPDADTTNTGYFNFRTKDDSIVQDQTRVLAVKREHSPQISYRQIANAFNDGKQAGAYALLVHIKQPIPGKRKVHRLADSGHSFITLVKYNTDTTYTSFSFGFYPHHHHPFAGTPLFPYSHSTFKNDNNYNSDETVGKFISKQTFNEILLMAKSYDGSRYNLNNHNCTDFVLDAALLADIYLTDTKGTWPLGYGNNPGITGQGILQGRILDGCNSATGSLFVDFDAKMVVKE